MDPIVHIDIYLKSLCSTLRSRTSRPVFGFDLTQANQDQPAKTRCPGRSLLDVRASSVYPLDLEPLEAPLYCGIDRGDQVSSPSRSTPELSFIHRPQMPVRGHPSAVLLEDVMDPRLTLIGTGGRDAVSSLRGIWKHRVLNSTPIGCYSTYRGTDFPIPGFFQGRKNRLSTHGVPVHSTAFTVPITAAPVLEPR